MDLGGTIPWMEPVESCLERRPRAKHDSRDGGGGNASGTAFEEPEPKPVFNQINRTQCSRISEKNKKLSQATCGMNKKDQSL